MNLFDVLEFLDDKPHMTLLLLTVGGKALASYLADMFKKLIS